MNRTKSREKGLLIVGFLLGANCVLLTYRTFFTSLLPSGTVSNNATSIYGTAPAPSSTTAKTSASEFAAIKMPAPNSSLPKPERIPTYTAEKTQDLSSSTATSPTRCCGPGCRERTPVTEAHYDAKYFQWQTTVGQEKAQSMNWTRHLGIQPGDTVADLGAGGGHILATLTTARTVAAVEINPSARASIKALYPWILRYRYPEEVPDNSLDLVFSTSAIEHFECPLQELREMVRKLRLGGRLIVGIKNEGPDFASQAYENDIHQHLWTWNRQLLYNVMRKAGVQVRKVDPPSQELLETWNKTKKSEPYIPYYWAHGVKI